MNSTTPSSCTVGGTGTGAGASAGAGAGDGAGDGAGAGAGELSIVRKRINWRSFSDTRS